MAQSIRIRVNKTLLGHAPGAEIEIPAKADGSPAELFWRRRLRDSAIDGCVSILPASVGASSASATIGDDAAAPAVGGK